MSEVIIAVVSGGSVVAVIEGVREWLSWRRNRKALKEDNEAASVEKAIEITAEKVNTLEEKVDALVEANRYILYDRIRFLGQCYIDEKEIDFDDRRILNKMHESYHNGLNGNGDLDTLMNEVNHLPLKHRGGNL